MIPCIKDKCLKLPACKNKTYIKCSLLRNVINQAMFGNQITREELRKKLRDQFPNIHSVDKDPPPKKNSERSVYIITHNSLYKLTMDKFDKGSI